MKKKSKRKNSDNYPTPKKLADWSVEHAIDMHPLKVEYGFQGSFLEPGCGNNFPFARKACKSGFYSIGVDLRRIKCVDFDSPSRHKGLYVAGNCDFLKEDNCEDRFDLIGTNPPYIHALPFIKRSLELLEPAGVAFFLLRLGFMASKGRVEFFKERPPSEVHVIAGRPSFTGDGKTDGSEYCFAFWRGKNYTDRRMMNGERVPTTFHWLDNRDW
jgi:hypothetical protein